MRILSFIFPPSFFAGYQNFKTAIIFSIFIDIFVILCFLGIFSNSKILLFTPILAILIANFISFFISKNFKKSKFIIGNSIWIFVCNVCILFFVILNIKVFLS